MIPAVPARNPAVPAYEWLYETIRTDILDGRLRPGARLPSTRDLATQYRLSRGTIVAAFEQLEGEGYVTGTVGSGTYVRDVLPDDLLVRYGGGRRAIAGTGHPKRILSYQGKRVREFDQTETRKTRAFRSNQPAVELFPTHVWGRLVAKRSRSATASQLRGCGPLGYRPLQHAISEYVNGSRGVNCVAGQVVIVSGTQEALDIAARLFINPGDPVCMEYPGYPGARLVFEAYGARIVRVGVGEEGAGVPAGRLRKVRLAYVTPAHQFPLGVSMSIARRLALLQWARESRSIIFEDDYDSEFRYSGRPLPSLQGLDNNGVVMFAGSFSKVMFPSLRLGYLVVPADLVDRVAALKSITNRHASVLEQATLCDFMTEGHFGRHIRRMREVYAERLGTLIHASRQNLDGLLDVSSVEAGLQTVGWLASGIDAERVASAAAERDVEVTPLSRYGSTSVTRRGLHMGFAAVDSKEILRGVRDLALAIEGLRPRKATH